MADTVGRTGETKQIPHAEWKDYFERFTRQHLRAEPPETVTVEVLSPTLGDQIEARNERLLGLTYDPRSGALDAFLEDIDHLVFNPVEIWVMEDEDGFVSTIELVREDGTKELLYIHRSVPPEPVYPGSSPPYA